MLKGFAKLLALACAIWVLATLSGPARAEAGGAILCGSEESQARFESVRMETGLELRGRLGRRAVDVAVYRDKSAGDAPGSEALVYALIDNDRLMAVARGETEEDIRYLFWPVGEDCPFPDEVDALYAAQRIYDYYAKQFGWRSPDGYGDRSFVVVTDVASVEGGGLIDNSLNLYQYDRAGEDWIFIGRPDTPGAVTMASEPEVLFHEYTHAVLYGKGIAGEAMHEAYADVMAVCASDEDNWYVGVVRRLDKPNDLHSEYTYLTNMSQYRDDIDAHEASTILSHAAYRMCESDLAGEPLSRRELARLFYTSMYYLPAGVDCAFADAGRALQLAADVLVRRNHSELTAGQAERVAAALEEAGIESRAWQPLIVAEPEFRLHVQDVNGAYYDNYRVELLEDVTGNTIADFRPEGDIVMVDTSGRPARMVLTDLKDPSRRLVYELIYSDEESAKSRTVPTNFGPFDLAADAVTEILRGKLTALKAECGAMETGVEVGSGARTDAELGGLLAARIEDFDGEGQPELLVCRFEAPFYEYLDLVMEMYEVVGGEALLSAARRLPVPGIASFMGKSGSSACGFLYRVNGGWHIGLESFLGTDGRRLTTACYAYTGSDFAYVRGAAWQEWGEGDVFVRRTDVEPAAEYVLDGGSDSEDGLTWATVDRYMIEDHDWSAPSDYEAQRLVNLYRGALGELGLVVAYDVRTAKREAPEDPVNYDWAAAENALYTQEPAAVYGLTDGYAPLWRVVSWNRPDAGLTLIREGSGLDADQ